MLRICNARIARYLPTQNVLVSLPTIVEAFPLFDFVSNIRLCRFCRPLITRLCWTFVNNLIGQFLLLLDALRLVTIWGCESLKTKLFEDREEIAKCLVKIFSQSGQAEQMINDIVSNEVNDAANTQTLFRANSMASKAIDVYMKQVGMSYLRQTIGPIINIITLSDKPCEVDPSRLEKKDDVDENWKNLINIMEATVQSLFSSVAIFPDSLRLIFAHLQKEVL
eukprot:Partr_v1_DN28657_c0_g1_i4_m50367 putative GTPase Activating protein